MELIKINDSKYEEYERLLLARDQVEKEAGQIWTAYMKEFGQLLSDIFEKKVESIKRKKIIAYYQQQINRGQKVDPEAIEEYLKKEMSAYYAQLRQLIEDTKRCKESKTSSSYEVKRSKELYHRIAKLIHPDINPETDNNDQLRALWSRAVIAYHANNVKELSEVEVLIRKVLKDLGLGNEKAEIPDILDKIEDLKDEIAGITFDEPYTFKYLLEDEEAVEEKKKELQKELDSYIHYIKQLDETIEELVVNGGVVVKWQMN